MRIVAGLVCAALAAGVANAGEAGKMKTYLVAGMEVPALPVSVLNSSLKPVAKTKDKGDAGKAEKTAAKGQKAHSKKDAKAAAPVKKPGSATVVREMKQARPAPKRKAEELPATRLVVKHKRKHARHQTAKRKSEPHDKGIDFAVKLVAKVVPGVNEIIKISQGHLNRIVTPFDIAVVETVSNATIQSKGESIYIATTDDRPITMFVHEKGEDDPSLSLTLIPSPIPPRQVRIMFDPEAGAYPVAGAKKWESKHPFVEGIKDAMTEIAKGRIPHGYGFRLFKPGRDQALIPECAAGAQGIKVEPKQVIEGSAVIYVISAVTNVSGGMVELREPYCYRKGVLAVAFWPRVLLKPGEKTELYVAYARPNRAMARQRKSVIR